MGSMLALIVAALLLWHSLKLLGVRSGQKTTLEIKPSEDKPHPNDHNPFAPPGNPQ